MVICWKDRWSRLFGVEMDEVKSIEIEIEIEMEVR